MVVAKAKQALGLCYIVTLLRCHVVTFASLHFGGKGVKKGSKK
ncbi:hypothetical protein EVA_21765 [gut metagenome]|uniref:Uncharacterized protein n=1 Tax=gut metagenome TaxID=749906 RepID=J9F6N6_9ZZZZ